MSYEQEVVDLFHRHQVFTENGELRCSGCEWTHGKGDDPQAPSRHKANVLLAFFDVEPRRAIIGGGWTR